MTSLTNNGIQSTKRAWQSRCRELAKWAWERLAIKRDRHGLYSPDGGASWSFSSLAVDELAAHFAGEVTLGCGAISSDDECLWVAWDLDNHNNDLSEGANLKYAIILKDRLSQMGLDAIIEDSDRRGGIHVWLLFRKPIPASLAFRFARHVTRDFPQHVPAVECFPKSRTSKTEKGCGGGYLRVPGKHHKRDHWSRFWATAHGSKLQRASLCCLHQRPMTHPLLCFRRKSLPRRSLRTGDQMTQSSKERESIWSESREPFPAAGVIQQRFMLRASW